MKKAILILLALTVQLSLVACGSSVVSKENNPPAASPSPTTVIQPSNPMPSATPESKPEEAVTPEPVQTEVQTQEKKAQDAVDVDLTQLSSTMVYSEVSAMMYEPEQYIGKTVKMHGLFATQEYDGARLYACIVQDATACCAQGLEFEMAEDLAYPDDYPEPGAGITVVGTFDSYKEEVDGNYYIYLVLRNARMV